MKWVRRGLGLILLPAIWGAGRSLVSILIEGSKTDTISFWIPLLCGLCGCLALGLFIPGMQRVYVIGHELTHALTGLCCGAKILGMKLHARSGSVTLTKSNMVIILSPYLLPFYTLLVLIVCLAIRLFWPNLHEPEGLWIGLVALTWGFHIMYTASTLFSTLQPDTRPYGYLFSHVLIVLVNLLTLVGAMGFATHLPCQRIAQTLSTHCLQTYQWCWATGCHVWLWLVATISTCC